MENIPLFNVIYHKHSLWPLLYSIYSPVNAANSLLLLRQQTGKGEAKILGVNPEILA